MSKVKVLYDFTGEPNSAELSVVAGDVLTVTNTNVGEGKTQLFLFIWKNTNIIT